MTFQLPDDCILTYSLAIILHLRYDTFSGSCLPLATGWTLRMFNARYSLRGNRITKNKSDAAVHHIIALTHCLSLQESCFTPHSEVIAKDKQIHLIFASL